MFDEGLQPNLLFLHYSSNSRQPIEDSSKKLKVDHEGCSSEGQQSVDLWCKNQIYSEDFTGPYLALISTPICLLIDQGWG